MKTIPSLLKKLLLFTLVMAILADLVNMLSFMKGVEVFTWISLGFFFFISLLVLVIGEKGIRSESTRIFTAMIQAGTLMRLLFGAGLVLGYALITRPSNKYFVIPFFFFYICYTVFDTYFLIKMVRNKKSQQQP